jgi:hypothetical protein
MVSWAVCMYVFTHTHLQNEYNIFIVEHIIPVHGGTIVLCR